MLETFGRYQLLKKIATGGMGQVYLARQKGPSGFEKILVVKRILPHLSEEEEFIQMFFDEARIAAILNHPNIAQIYDLGEVDGLFYIAMEYVHGESVRELGRKAAESADGVPLPLKCRIIADAAAGLDYAHRAKSPSGRPLGLIHRDVSPQNVLVGYNGSVKLIDFGIAKAANKMSQTMTGAIKGKYAYMSPEQARGEELDHRSDVFGLGIIFYELLTHSRLFKRESDTATLKAVVGHKITPPSTVSRGVPKQLDTILLKALARKREDRFQTAGELQLALEELLVKLRQPATSAHLSAFMHALYAEKLAKDRLHNEITQPSTVKEQEAREAAHRAAQAARRMEHEEASKSKGPEDGPTLSETQGSSMGLPRELMARMRSIAKGDFVGGLFFNAVLDTIQKVLGAKIQAAIRSNGPSRNYVDNEGYPTAEFLLVLWKASEALAETAGNMEAAYQVLGAACMESLLRSPLGKGLTALPQDAKKLTPPILSSLESLLAPGERSVESTNTRGVSLRFDKDVLPAAFHAGLLRHAFERLQGVQPEVGYVLNGENQFALNLSW